MYQPNENLPRPLISSGGIFCHDMARRAISRAESGGDKDDRSGEICRANRSRNSRAKRENRAFDLQGSQNRIERGTRTLEGRNEGSDRKKQKKQSRPMKPFLPISAPISAKLKTADRFCSDLRRGQIVDNALAAVKSKSASEFL
jgi:hypothetical protein